MSRLRTRTVLSLLALAAFAAAPAHAQQPATTLTANGIGEAKPEPENRNSDASIRKAVAEANAKALPEAMDNARAHAAELAQRPGVTLGPLVSISDSPNNGYGFFVQNGTFGNGHFCGKLRDTHTVRTQRRPPPRGVEGHAPGLPSSRGDLRHRVVDLLGHELTNSFAGPEGPRIAGGVLLHFREAVPRRAPPPAVVDGHAGYPGPTVLSSGLLRVALTHAAQFCDRPPGGRRGRAHRRHHRQLPAPGGTARRPAPDVDRASPRPSPSASPSASLLELLDEELPQRQQEGARDRHRHRRDRDRDAS